MKGRKGILRNWVVLGSIILLGGFSQGYASLLEMERINSPLPILDIEAEEKGILIIYEPATPPAQPIAPGIQTDLVTPNLTQPSDIAPANPNPADIKPVADPSLTEVHSTNNPVTEAKPAVKPESVETVFPTDSSNNPLPESTQVTETNGAGDTTSSKQEFANPKLLREEIAGLPAEELIKILETDTQLANRKIALRQLSSMSLTAEQQALLWNVYMKILFNFEEEDSMRSSTARRILEWINRGVIPPSEMVALAKRALYSILKEQGSGMDVHYANIVKAVVGNSSVSIDDIKGMAEEVMGMIGEDILQDARLTPRLSQILGTIASRADIPEDFKNKIDDFLLKLSTGELAKNLAEQKSALAGLDWRLTLIEQAENKENLFNENSLACLQEFKKIVEVIISNLQEFNAKGLLNYAFRILLRITRLAEEIERGIELRRQIAQGLKGYAEGVREGEAVTKETPAVTESMTIEEIRDYLLSVEEKINKNMDNRDEEFLNDVKKYIATVIKPQLEKLDTKQDLLDLAERILNNIDNILLSQGPTPLGVREGVAALDNIANELYSDNNIDPKYLPPPENVHAVICSSPTYRYLNNLFSSHETADPGSPEFWEMRKEGQGNKVQGDSVGISVSIPAYAAGVVSSFTARSPTVGSNTHSNSGDKIRGFTSETGGEFTEIRDEVWGVESGQFSVNSGQTRDNSGQPPVNSGQRTVKNGYSIVSSGGLMGNSNLERKVKALFTGRSLPEILAISPNTPEGDWVIKYLGKNNNLISLELRRELEEKGFSMHSLTSPEIASIFKEGNSPNLWQAILLTVYLSFNKDISFTEDFVKEVKEAGVSELSIAYAGILRGENVERMIGLLGDKLTPEQKEIFEKTGILVSGESDWVRRIGRILMNYSNLGLSNLGIIFMQTGLCFISSKGIFLINLGGEGLSLEEMLRMVMKIVLTTPPPMLRLPPFENLPPGMEFLYYLQYGLILIFLWKLRRIAKGIDWRFVYKGISQEIKEEKDQLKILIKAKMLEEDKDRRVSGNREIRDSRRFGYRDVRIKDARLKELEIDLDKRLNQIKYWADYLASLNLGKGR